MKSIKPRPVCRQRGGIERRELIAGLHRRVSEAATGEAGVDDAAEIDEGRQRSSGRGRRHLAARRDGHGIHGVIAKTHVDRAYDARSGQQRQRVGGVRQLDRRAACAGGRMMALELAMAAAPPA